jgi:hypothetical protein
MRMSHPNPTHVIWRNHAGWRPVEIMPGEHYIETVLRELYSSHSFLSNYANHVWQFSEGRVTVFDNANDIDKHRSWFTCSFHLRDQARCAPTGYRINRIKRFVSKNKKKKTHAPDLDTLSLCRVPWYAHEDEFTWGTCLPEIYEDVGDAIEAMKGLSKKLNLRYFLPHGHPEKLVPVEDGTAD